MTNPTQLNPDALTRCDIMAGQIGAWIDEWDDGKADTAHVATHVANRLAENGLTTLATAQPEVNSVEELDALPAGSLVRSGGREFYKTSYIDLPWILPYGVDRFASGYLAKHSKVTVTHRPEVNDA